MVGITHSEDEVFTLRENASSEKCKPPTPPIPQCAPVDRCSSGLDASALAHDTFPTIRKPSDSQQQPMYQNRLHKVGMWGMALVSVPAVTSSSSSDTAEYVSTTGAAAFPLARVDPLQMAKMVTWVAEHPVESNSVSEPPLIKPQDSKRAARANENKSCVGGLRAPWAAQDKVPWLRPTGCRIRKVITEFIATLPEIVKTKVW